MKKQLIFIDFDEIFKKSEERGVPILRILYDDYIPKSRYTNNQNPSIIYQKKERKFVIYY